jgi:hypothetical protein
MKQVIIYSNHLVSCPFRVPITSQYSRRNEVFRSVLIITTPFLLAKNSKCILIILWTVLTFGLNINNFWNYSTFLEEQLMSLPLLCIVSKNFWRVVILLNGRGRIIPELSTTSWRRMKEWRYSFTHSSLRLSMDASGQLHVPASFVQGNSLRCPLDRRLRGPQSFRVLILSNEYWSKNLEEYHDILEQKYASSRPTLTVLFQLLACPGASSNSSVVTFIIWLAL